MSDGITEQKSAKPKYRPTGNIANLTGMGKGRPKGVQNIINRDIKEMVFKALHEVGGHLYLVEQAYKNPNAFMALVSM
jgi:hypothetical protein